MKRTSIDYVAVGIALACAMAVLIVASPALSQSSWFIALGILAVFLGLLVLQRRKILSAITTMVIVLILMACLLGSIAIGNQHGIIGIVGLPVAAIIACFGEPQPEHDK